MFLHENRWSFKETLKLASEETGIPPAIIEQDYFQTLLLQHISLIEKTPITLGGIYAIQKTRDGISRLITVLEISLLHEIHKNRKALERLVLGIIEVLDILDLEIYSSLSTKKFYQEIEIWYPTYFCSRRSRSSFILKINNLVPVNPVLQRSINSILSQTLSDWACSEYGTSDFKISTVSPYRVLVDTMLRLIDFFTKDDYTNTATCIYDLSRLVNMFKWNDDKTIKRLRKIYRSVLWYYDETVMHNDERDIFTMTHMHLLEIALRSDDVKTAYNDTLLPTLIEKASYEACLDEIVRFLDLSLLT